MAIRINNECKACRRKFMHDPFQPRVCDDCLKQSMEIAEYMDETGDWKGVLKRIKEMEANFILSSGNTKRNESAIQLYLSDEEASLLLTCMGKFLAHGGIWSHLPKDYTLLKEDTDRNDKAMKTVESWYNEMQQILQERYHDQQMNSLNKD